MKQCSFFIILSVMCGLFACLSPRSASTDGQASQPLLSVTDTVYLHVVDTGQASPIEITWDTITPLDVGEDTLVFDDSTGLVQTTVIFKYDTVSHWRVKTVVQPCPPDTSKLMVIIAEDSLFIHKSGAVILKKALARAPCPAVAESDNGVPWWLTIILPSLMLLFYAAEKRKKKMSR